MLMDLRQLAYFVAVAEEASFTKAANRLQVAQPGVSAQIRRLELELGHELLDRKARPVRPTEVGAAVLPHARAALEATAAARRAVDELEELLRGRVAVGAVVACSSLALVDLLAGFHRLHPAVEISLSEANSDELLGKLKNGELDLAFAAFGDRPPEWAETEVAVEEALFLAVCRDHPLAGRRAVGLEVLGEQALICLPRGTGVRAALENACAAAGVRPRIALEASDPRMVAELARRGLGVAVLPESLARADPASLRAIGIAKPRPRASLALAWKRAGPHSPAGRALIRHARAALGSGLSGRPEGPPLSGGPRSLRNSPLQRPPGDPRADRTGLSGTAAVVGVMCADG